MNKRIKFKNGLFSLGYICLLSGLCLGLLLIKIQYVNWFVAGYTGVNYFGAFKVIQHDALIGFLLISFFYLSFLKQCPRLIQYILRISATIILLLYAIDIYVFINFSNHLVFTDILKFSSYALNYIYQLYGLPIIVITFLLVSSLIITLFKINFVIRNTYQHLITFITLGFFISIYLMNNYKKDSYVHSWVYKNIFEHNKMVWEESRQYSESFINNLRFEETFQCVDKTQESPNIIFLMVESLSSYQSNFFSGIKNWTPFIDQIARENIAFTNFYANGFTTEDGEISLLTGEIPLYPPMTFSDGGGQAFQGFYNIPSSLPYVLKTFNYHTAFLTTADLDFANTGNWALSIGFDVVEGHENKLYNNYTRGQFKAAPDEALFLRILEYQKSLTSNYFLFIKTVSTHHPFENPKTGEKSEEAAFKYTDQEIGKFYGELVKSRFFDTGILVIVGDHHAMIPIKSAENNLYGEYRAPAAVPMIIASKQQAYLNDNPYQQTDVYQSFKSLVSGTHCTSDWLGNFFLNRTANNIAHKHGSQRNLVSIYRETGDIKIKLNGDDTELINIEMGKNELQVLNKINAIRTR